MRSKSPARCPFFRFCRCRFFRKFPRSPLKRRLRRAFWPPGPPKAVPRSTRGLPRRSRFHLSVQMLVLFGVFEKNENVTATFLFFLSYVIIVVFGSSPRRPPEGPKGAQEAPGSPPERPKRPQEAPKSAPGGSKRASRDPKSRSRGLKTRPRASRASQDAHKVFPKHFVRQPFSEKWKKSNCKSSQESFKMSTRFFRSTWSGSRFRKNKQIQIIAPKSIEDT